MCTPNKIDYCLDVCNTCLSAIHFEAATQNLLPFFRTMLLELKNRHMKDVLLHIFALVSNGTFSVKVYPLYDIPSEDCCCTGQILT